MAEKVEAIEKYALSKNNATSKALFSKVGLLGSGSVGQSIAKMVGARGLDIVFIEENEKRINSVLKEIENDLNKNISRWGMTNSEKNAIMIKIKGSSDWNELKDCEIILETLESKKNRQLGLEQRKKIYKEIEKYVSPTCIIATNTTSLMATELISELDHQERGISFHFLSPFPEVPLVEVVRGINTSDDVFENTVKFAQLIDKEVINVLDFAGKISTRMIIPLINEACEILMEGVGTMKDIDKVMKEGYHMQMGPFEMADTIGLDNIQRWMDNMYDEFGDLKYKASPLIKKLVRANCLGKKNGKGFYEYDKDLKIIKNLF